MAVARGAQNVIKRTLEKVRGLVYSEIKSRENIHVMAFIIIFRVPRNFERLLIVVLVTYSQQQTAVLETTQLFLIDIKGPFTLIVHLIIRIELLPELFAK